MTSYLLWKRAIVAAVALAVINSSNAYCPSDLNNDGQTDGGDLSVVLAQWGNCASGSSCMADVNGDGVVDGADLAELLAGWGSCPTPPPHITSVSPASGPSVGGTMITVTGVNLTGAISVRVGVAEATNVDVVSSTTVTAVTPAGATGAHDVLVTTPGGTASLPIGFTYNVVVPSWATLIEPLPSPAVVHDSALRAAIIATGYAWRVSHTATQIEMMLIPPGVFEMGCSASQSYPCESDEFPIRTVTLTQPFYMGRFEVTQAQWTARMGSNPSAFQSASTQVPASQVPRRPVDTVSWNMVQGFLSATGMRLPTEAEWEYAYRAGTTTAFHSMPGYPDGTNNDSLVGNIAWFEGNAEGQTRPVGQLAGNGFGLCDMAGNVREWVSDWYGPYPAIAQTDPAGPGFGNRRIGRGGGWFLHSPLRVRSSERSLSTPGYAYHDTGFRVARNP